LTISAYQHDKASFMRHALEYFGHFKPLYKTWRMLESVFLSLIYDGYAQDSTTRPTIGSSCCKRYVVFHRTLI